MSEFPAIRPFGGDFPSVNPTSGDSRVTTFIPSESVGVAQIGQLESAQITGVGAKIYRSTNQTLATDTDTALSFDTVVFAQGGFVDLAGAPTLITVPRSGVYLCTATVEFASSATTTRRVRWRINGSVAEGESTEGVSGGLTTRMLPTTTRRLTQGDTIAVNAYQKSGGNLDVNAGEDACAMTVVLLFAI